FADTQVRFPQVSSRCRVVCFYLHELLVELQSISKDVPPNRLHLGYPSKPFLADARQHLIDRIARFAVVEIGALTLPIGYVPLFHCFLSCVPCKDGAPSKRGNREGHHRGCSRK